MKGGLAIALALALGALAGHFLLQDNGYVLVSFQGYVVEMSVPIALALLVLAYLAVRLVAWLWRVPRQLGEATARARVRWAGRQATRGYYAQVWSLVLFLQHHGFGGYASAFENLLKDAGTERLRNRIREYASNTPATAGLGQGEAVFRCYIADDMDFFERQYREFCRKLVR